MRQSPTQHNSRKCLYDWLQSEVPPEVPMTTRLPVPCPSPARPPKTPQAATLGASRSTPAAFRRPAFYADACIAPPTYPLNPLKPLKPLKPLNYFSHFSGCGVGQISANGGRKSAVPNPLKPQKYFSHFSGCRGARFGRVAAEFPENAPPRTR